MRDEAWGCRTHGTRSPYHEVPISRGSHITRLRRAGGPNAQKAPSETLRRAAASRTPARSCHGGFGLGCKRVQLSSPKVSGHGARMIRHHHKKLADTKLCRSVARQTYLQSVYIHKPPTLMREPCCDRPGKVGIGGVGPVDLPGQYVIWLYTLPLRARARQSRSRASRSSKCPYTPKPHLRAPG